MLSKLPYAERELLLKVSEGDVDAFRTLYDHYRNKIFSIAWKLTSDETLAEDVVQEVFIKLWVNKEKLSDLDYFNSYLNVVTRNYIFNHLRKLANENAYLRELTVTGEPTQDSFDTLVHNELQNALKKAITHLPPQQKKVYLLSRIEGLKHQEISDILHISRSTVKSHMVEALRFIKGYLGIARMK
ncbi:MAG: RNA polymerase sigma-70 factor [Ginsengibacter sp.]